MKGILKMDKTNQIERAIGELDGEQFQTFANEYISKKYDPKRMVEYGSQPGTNKVRNGDPDTYIDWEDGTYTLIMLTTTQNGLLEKLRKDISDCLNRGKVNIERGKIKEIICIYTSSRISVENSENLKALASEIKITLIDLNVMARDLNNKYPKLAYDFFQISVDTGQILSIRDFVEKYDAIKMSAPLSLDFLHRSAELTELRRAIVNHEFTLITGPAGVGKTRIALEACKYYKDEGYIIYCIKNNGESLVEDIRDVFTKDGKYILFIDDINMTKSLQYVFDSISNLPSSIQVNVVATARNYVVAGIIDVIDKYFEISFFNLSNFKDKELTDILIEDLEIKDSQYLDRIIEISKGNARLAILAGISVKKGGYASIQNAIDIFRNYYTQVFKTEKLNIKMIETLFIVAFFSRLSMETDKQYRIETLLSFFELSHVDFINNCKLLNASELVDIYEGNVVKLSNQNFGDYILEYVLIEEKYITVERLLDLTFSGEMDRNVYAINTLNNIFSSEQMEEYISTEINNSWNKASEDLENRYLKTFYMLNEAKALLFVKRYIDKLGKVKMDLSQVDFVSEQSTSLSKLSFTEYMVYATQNKIKKEEKQLVFDVLAGFKNLSRKDHALKLIIKILEKRPDWAHDIYKLLVDHYCFDQFSPEKKFINEIELVDMLSNAAYSQKDTNLMWLMVQVFRSLLHCNFDCILPMDNKRTVQSIQYKILLTPEIKELRLKIWNTLIQLYDKYNEFHQTIESILIENFGTGLTKKEFKNIYLFDLTYIKQLIDKWKTYDFSRCQILFKISELAFFEGIDNEYFISKYIINKDFSLYLMISGQTEEKRPIHGRTAERKNRISNIISGYTQQDFRYLFLRCKEWEQYSFVISVSLSIGITTIFEIIQDDPFFEEIMSEYIRSGTPCDDPSLISNVLSLALKRKNFDELVAILNEITNGRKHFWIGILWELLPEQEITRRRTEQFIDSFKVALESGQPFIPDVRNLKKFNKFNKSMSSVIGSLMLNVDDLQKKGWVDSFLAYRTDLIDYFKDNIEVLEKLYLNVSDTMYLWINLGMDILEVDSNFWDSFLGKLLTMDLYNIDKTALLRLWLLADHDEYVDYLFNQKREIFNTDLVEALFNSSTDKKIAKRQNCWIKNFISKNSFDKRLMIRLFTLICNKFGDERIEFYKCLFGYSKNIDLILSLPLFPSHYSINGSEIPLIDKKIVFLKKLIINIEDIDLLEFEENLQEILDQQKKHRKKVKIMEALEFEYF